MAPAEPLKPSKQDVALAVLGAGSLFIHLDPRRAGVRVPRQFHAQAQLVLQVGRNLAIPIPDLVVDGDGIRATLSFRQIPFLCVLPWPSIYALVGDDGRGGMWQEDVPAEVRAQQQGPKGSAAPGGTQPEAPQAEQPPSELLAWSAEVAGRMATAGIVARRAVTAVNGRRLVVDVRGTTFGAVLGIALGDDPDAPAGRQGPYRGGPAAGRGVPRFEMRRRTALVRALASLGVVREIGCDDPGFMARVSVRSDAPVQEVQAALARAALRDAAVDLFDSRFDEVGVRRGSLVDARRSDPTLADVEIGGLWYACRALSRIADALEEAGGG